MNLEIQDLLTDPILRTFPYFFGSLQRSSGFFYFAAMGLISGILGNSTETSAEAANERLSHVLIEGEQIVKSFKLIRDELHFTNCRLIWIDKQGITERKQDILSIPYKSIDRFSMENAGLLDMDAEMNIWVKGHPAPLAFKFSKGTHIDHAHLVLASYVLMA